MGYEIILSTPTPSLNKFTYAMSPFAQFREKKKWANIIRAGYGFLAVPHASGKRKLTVIRYGRPLDPDNLIGGLKCCVIDNLKNFKLLIDDSAQYLELHAECRKPDKNAKPHTILILEDI